MIKIYLYLTEYTHVLLGEKHPNYTGKYVMISRINLDLTQTIYTKINGRTIKREYANGISTND